MIAFKLIPFAALILIIIAVAPLAAFVYSVSKGGLDAAIEISGNSLKFVLNYNMSVYLTDVKLVMIGKTANQTLSNTTSVEELHPGDTIDVSIPIEAYEELRVTLEGKIAGIYEVRLTISKSLTG